MSTLKPSRPPIEYPDSDDRPIADNTLPFERTSTVKRGLDVPGPYSYAPNAGAFSNWPCSSEHLGPILREGRWLGPRLHIRDDRLEGKSKAFGLDDCAFVKPVTLARQRDLARASSAGGGGRAGAGRRRAKGAMRLVLEERRCTQKLAERLREPGIEPDA